jgi:phosphotriesterase-related protein
MSHTPESSPITRRSLLAGALAACAVGAAGAATRAGGRSKKMVQTVSGPVEASKLGFTLTHEHVLCDFAGAEVTDPGRWNPDEVYATMLPYLKQARERGVRAFVDCSPAYIGRDPRLLQRLAKASGLHLLTNTGYYGAAGDKYVPKHAYTETAQQLADRWTAEWEHGIEGTGIKPGFIKIGVDPAQGAPPRLSEIDAKLVRAAAITHLRTGLTIASHTGQGLAALEELAILKDEGVAPSAFIFVHADGEPDQALRHRVAAMGAWVSYDGVSPDSVTRHVGLVTAMLKEHPDRLLLSHDAGWYQAGEKAQKPRDYNCIPDALLPALRKAGVPEADLRRLTVTNPAEAFTVRIRRQA